jgi:phosphoglycerate dehydrogenase-like enzyme
MVGFDGLDTVLSTADYLLVTLALTPETKHFLRLEHFQKMKSTSILINLGRGLLLDEEALIVALETKIIAGAALDVFTVEPLPADSKLWQLSNALLSPHNADLTVDSRHKSVRFFTENCKKFLANEELECIVDKKSGY